jgi:putative flavoprotein involved in K+ transport
MASEDSFHTIVVGGGQAGLAAGYYLTQRKVDFAILDENLRSGESWRSRWDSLRLFTPSFNNHLPGMKFAKPDMYFPTKDETGDYLEIYASQNKLPVLYGTKVGTLERNAKGYQLHGSEKTYHARNVIIATGPFHTPYIPSQATELENMFQLHSKSYRNPAGIPAQKVLVVGAGNSGAEIALDLAKAGKQVWLAGRDVGGRPAEKLSKVLGAKGYWWFMRRMMTDKTPIGRKLKDKVLAHGAPLIRARREDVAAAGVELAPRLRGVRSGRPQLEDGRVLPAEAVIWATGFRPDYDWIKIPIFGENGRPRHEHGVAADAPGVYFLGLLFQTGLTSSLLGGVGEDAKYVVDQIGA